jgi:peptide methionine sulfoxide reductase msrA/msrB
MMQRMARLPVLALCSLGSLGSLVSLGSLAVAVPSAGCESAKPTPPVVARPPIDPNGPREVAILAGGCFWGMEKVLRDAPGVVSVEVGYAGGASRKVSYEDVSEGNTGHAESVRIVFDPHQLPYEDLLAHWFFRGHDPTTPNRQNNDIGTQYRSEIFTTSDAQRQTAEAVKARVEKTGKWKRPIVTKIEPATTWVRAEEYHQDYLIKHPDGYNDHWLRDFDF